MPRKPSNRSIIREIRQVLGWTQLQLANRLGVTLSTLNRVENGSLKISRRLALRLCWATGVPYADIVSNKEGPPQTLRGPLSPETLVRMDQEVRELKPQDLKMLATNVAWLAESLFRAAFEDAPAKLWSLDAAIQAELAELETEFGLAGSVKRIRQSDLEAANEALGKDSEKASSAVKMQLVSAGSAKTQELPPL